MAPDAPTRRRSAETGGSGSRDTRRPPAPEPLPHPVVDNHCHLDIADGDWTATSDAIAAAAAVGVPRIVQIGCDLEGGPRDRIDRRRAVLDRFRLALVTGERQRQGTE